MSREKFIDYLLAVAAGVLLALGGFYGLDHQLQIEEKYNQR